MNVPSKGQPQQIDRYYVVECIGRGAMGVVYRARDEAVGRDVAIKLLVADLEDEPDIRTRFLREAETTARLTHPNIITIFDIGEDHGRLYIVMELLRGATLKDYLRSETLPPRRKLDLMIQLCSGLGAAHSAGVFHRDIKPGNLFVRTDGILKILDFGIARLASSAMTRAGFILGTPDYMSPEQARGGTVDARSDIFSVGSVLYFMITGRKPFAATDLPTIFRQVESQDPVPLTAAEAPPELARVLAKAMSKNVALRHQSCQELMAELIEVRRQFPAGTRRVTAGRSAVVADTDDVETAHTDKPRTAHREKPLTTHTDKLPTAHTDKPATAHTDRLPSAHTDKPLTAHTDKPPTAHTDRLPTAHTDKPPTAHTDKLPTAHTDRLPTAHTDRLPTAHTDKLPTALTDKLQPAPTDKLEPAPTVKLQPAPPIKLPAVHTDKPPTNQPDKLRTTEVQRGEAREMLASPGPRRPDDTIDWVPFPSIERDDTGPTSAPVPRSRFIHRLGTLFSSVIGRIRRARAEYARRRALRRKG